MSIGFIYIYIHIVMSWDVLSVGVSAADWYLRVHIKRVMTVLNFTRSWCFVIFRVYWVSKSKCIISSNLRAEGS